VIDPQIITAKSANLAYLLQKGGGLAPVANDIEPLAQRLAAVSFRSSGSNCVSRRIYFQDVRFSPVLRYHDLNGQGNEKWGRICARTN